jgi:hypothetical protein
VTRRDADGPAAQLPVVDASGATACDSATGARCAWALAKPTPRPATSRPPLTVLPAALDAAYVREAPLPFVARSLNGPALRAGALKNAP